MTEQPWAHKYTLTVPTEDAARQIADLLALRGHRLVAVRGVDHFHHDPDSWWYGKPSLQPEYEGWWEVHSVALDPPDEPDLMDRAEYTALGTLARRFGGVSDGSSAGAADTMLMIFPRVGLVHELGEELAAQVRREVRAASTPEQPSDLPPSPLPLAHEPFDGGPVGLAALAEQIPAHLPEAEAAPYADNLGDSVGTVLGDLFNGAMHQDTVDADTASWVPLFAALAVDDRLGGYRAWALMDLFMIASVGRRHLCATADTDRALGRTPTDTPEAVAARAAVAAALPGLVGRWDAESELGRLLLAGVAAACPEAAGPLLPRLAEIAEASQGTTRASTVRLIDGLARGDEATVEAAMREVDAWHPETALWYDSPYPTAEQRGLCVLEDLLTDELGAAE